MPKSSKLWNYFVKSEDHDFMAICQFCGKLFSYKTTSSNLKAHLKQKHPLVYDDLLQTSESDLSAVLNIITALLFATFRRNGYNLLLSLIYQFKTMMTSKMWDYFLQCESDDGVKRAQCTFCERLLSYSSTTYNLKSHLMRLHPEEVGFNSTDKLRSSVLKPLKNSEQRNLPTLKRRNESVVWSFFTKSETNERVATCNLCNKTFSYRSSNTNLRTHLKRTHPDEFNENDIDDKNEISYNESGDDDTVQSNTIDDESNHSTAEADAWSFFEKETGGRARCVVCRASLPHRIRDLRQHLKDNHPKLAQDFDQASDSDEDQNDSYTEVVYLEEETRKVKKPQKIPRISYTNSPMVKPAKISKLNTSTNERHDENDDQIEKFSNYVASLLKEVPKDACMKLQMEIINLIMTTKLKLTTETTENKMIIDGVPVAIQTVNAVPGAGFIVTVPTTVSTAHPAPVAPTVPQNKPTFTVEDTKESMNECRDLPKL
ncbi:uncharacterized protein LOC106720889 isoform X1 [Papilio machaon]|uniref:uncharacterized protein LOC106720889 isoform X1 n=1 Tax=Papilio machaon TaxID=76193 RepID=UPI001E662BDA|nr:uncharacterized protein LOC106720889 isoform X1 [Papilio machaon]